MTVFDWLVLAYMVIGLVGYVLMYRFVLLEKLHMEELQGGCELYEEKYYKLQTAVNLMRDELGDLNKEFDAARSMIDTVKQESELKAELTKKQIKSAEMVEEGISNILTYDYLTAAKRSKGETE